MKTTERGYFKLITDEGDKWAHFSRTFLGELKKLSGKSLPELGESLQNEKDQDAQFDAFTDLLEAGLNAYALENNEEITWNTYKVGNWLWEHLNEGDENIVEELLKALTFSIPKAKGKGNKEGK